MSTTMVKSICSFGKVLEGVAHAPLASAERKCAVRRAVEVALLGTSALPGGGGDFVTDIILSDYEMALAAVGRAMGAQDTVDISTAKTWLRERGTPGAAAAALLGKMSKIRNARAHALLVQLTCKLEQLVAQAHVTRTCFDSVASPENAAAPADSTKGSIDIFGHVDSLSGTHARLVALHEDVVKGLVRSDARADASSPERFDISSERGGLKSPAGHLGSSLSGAGSEEFSSSPSTCTSDCNVAPLFLPLAHDGGSPRLAHAAVGEAAWCRVASESLRTFSVTSDNSEGEKGGRPPEVS